jgi:serine/threonine protein kinase
MSNALPAGHVLQEYRVEKLLGVGGFGLTYLATDQNLSLKVALKEYLPGDIAVRGVGHSILPKSEAEAETFGWGKQRFLDESRTLASFRHPNIVRVMRFFEANGTAYMVMEFVEGSALSDWLAPRRPLAEAQIAALVGPLLDGLEVVHKAGFMHRDIKPANIYVREDGSPVLLDFGSARQKSAELTAVVSPGYAPFEQYHTQGGATSTRSAACSTGW